MRAGEFPNLPAVGRGTRIFLGWTFAGVALMLIYMMLVPLVSGRPSLLAFSALIFAPFQLIGAVMWIRWSRRIKRDVEAHDLKCCPNCLYPIGESAAGARSAGKSSRCRGWSRSGSGMCGW